MTTKKIQTTKLPEWATDPDAVLRRQAKLEREADQHAAGCATLIRAFVLVVMIVGIVGGLISLVGR
jgi:hypothetical protein